MPSLLIRRSLPYGQAAHFSWPDGVKAAYYANGVGVSVSRSVVERADMWALTINGAVVGSTVKITKAIDGAVLTTGIMVAATQVFSVQYTGDIVVELRKAMASPFYMPFLAGVSLVADTAIAAIQARED